MDKKFCTICEADVTPEEVNYEKRCPRCKMPMNDDKKPLSEQEKTTGLGTPQSEPERPIGFGTAKPSSKRQGTGWGS